MSSVTRRHLLGAAAAAAGGAAVARPAGMAVAASAAQPTFRDRVVNLPDAILAVREIGKGEPIVIHPSLARGARDFDALAVLLAAGGYRVISLDPRGIGQSWAGTAALEGRTLHDYAADMFAAIRALGLRRVHVLGHAYGNRVARTLATDHPDVVETVLLCACGGGIPAPDVVVGLSKVTNAETSAEEIRATTKRIFFAPGNDPRPWHAGWYAVGGRAEQASVGLTPFDQIEGGGGKPMFIVQGKNDIVAPPSIGHGLRSKYGKRVTVVDLADAGHAMIIEQTAKVAEQLLRYLARHRIGR